jgi:AP2 domain
MAVPGTNPCHMPIWPLEVRRRQHVSLSGHGMLAQAPVYGWIRSLLRERREPVIIELESVPVEQAVAAEDAWMAHYRASGFTVLNLRSGRTGSLTRGISQQKYPTNQFSAGCRYRGITRSGKTRWRAIVQHKGVYQNLGTYDTAEEAARAYDKAALALFGDAALLNFPSQRADSE